MKGVNKTLQCKSLREYLKTLPKDTLNKLYHHPATCMAVLRELPELCKNIGLRFLCITEPISQKDVIAWNPQSKSVKENSETPLEHKKSLQLLLDLKIWQETQDEMGNLAYIMNPIFQKYLQIAHFGGGESWLKIAPKEADAHQRDVEFLEKYALERWESVLQFLVNPASDGPKVISRDAVRTLLHAELIETGERNVMQITSAGFQFLLMDTASQVWYFILKYLETVRERGLKLETCLTFIFKLSFLTLGKDYSMEGMDQDHLTFLQHLREFGLVYLRKRSAGRFYPTSLALGITAGRKKSSGAVSKSGNMIIETNYRIYVHTPSELQTSLLHLFSDLEYRFPNLDISTITRTSVRRALIKGIGAEQIISFLMQHAHPQMYTRNPIIPRTIADQIKLWEMERERLEFTEGVLYKDFASVHDFSLLSNYAAGKGVLIYTNEKTRTMVVTKKGHPAIKTFWKDTQNK